MESRWRKKKVQIHQTSLYQVKRSSYVSVWLKASVNSMEMANCKEREYFSLVSTKVLNTRFIYQAL